MRRVKRRDVTTGRTFHCRTSNCEVVAAVAADLCRSRW